MHPNAHTAPAPYHPDNDPASAQHARSRIHALPDVYSNPPAPPKEELAKGAKPVSPVAVAQPSYQDMPQLSDTALMKPKTPSMRTPLLVGLACFLIPLIIFKLWPIAESQLKYNSIAKTSSQSATANQPAVGPNPVLSIPKINVNAPIVFSKSNEENAIQTDLQSGVVHYAGTAEPGHKGNAVIFGHSSNDWWQAGNYKFVFILLDKLAVGDTFNVDYQGKRYTYQVSNIQTVDPSQVGVLAQTPDATLTLITCTPPGTNWKRLVVTSKLVGEPADGSAPASSTVQSDGTLPSNAPGIQQQAGGVWDGVKNLFRRQPGTPVQ